MICRLTVNYFRSVVIPSQYSVGRLCGSNGKALSFAVSSNSILLSEYTPYTMNFTYLLTPWSRVLQKPISSQVVEKFPAVYGTRRFITLLTSVRHLSLS